MLSEINNLLQKLEGLTHSFNHLGNDLGEAAKQLRKSKQLPSEQLVEKIQTTRSQFEDLCRETQEIKHLIFTDSRSGDIASSTDITSLNDLKLLLEEMAKESKKREAESSKFYQDALLILRKVLAITHRDSLSFPSLLTCQQTARQLQIKIEQNAGDYLDARVSKVVQSLDDLIVLVSSLEDLSDEGLTKLKQSVEGEWGEDLARAASRGRLVFLANEDNLEEASGAVDPIHEESNVDKNQQQNSGMPDGIALQETPEKIPEEIVISEEHTKPKSSIQEQFQPGFAQQLAVAILEETLNFQKIDCADLPARLYELVIQLLNNQKYGLAFHLTRCLERQFPSSALQYLPSWLIRSLALGAKVLHDVGSGEIANLLIDDFTNFSHTDLIEGENDWNCVINLLLFTSSIRPALLAPNTNVSEVLSKLRLKEWGFEQLNEFCVSIADYSNYRQPLNFSALSSVNNQAAWTEERDALRQEAESWFKNEARNKTINYAPATKVWRKWLDDGQEIHALLQPILEEREVALAQINQIRRQIKQLSNEAEVVRRIDRTDREVLKRRPGEDIRRVAFRQIYRHLQEAVAFVRRWLTLQDSQPDSDNGFLHQQAKQLKDQLSELQSAVFAELSLFQVGSTSPLLLFSLEHCREGIHQVQSLFLKSPEPHEPFVRHILGADLLKIVDLDTDENWEPHSRDSHEILTKIVKLIAGDNITWSQAFEFHSQVKNHDATEKIIELLKSNPDYAVDVELDIEELEQERKKQLQQSQKDLGAAVNQARNWIESAFSLDVLREAERADYTDRIETTFNLIDKTIKFSEKHTEINAIIQEIQRKQDQEIGKVRQRLDDLNLASDSEAYQRIQRLLEQRDILTANEYIYMAEHGEEVPEQKERDPFSDFFEGKERNRLESIAELLRSKKGWNEALHRVRNKEDIAGIRLDRLLDAQAKRATELLETWFIVSQRKTIDREQINAILSNLDFKPLNIEIKNKSSNERTVIRVTTEAIRDKKTCPVAFYGSDAEGNYQIICLWDKPIEEELLRSIQEFGPRKPIIVFRFGEILSTDRRNLLARLSRNHKNTFIVIDTPLIVYLCTERGARLPVLFDCTLPFTYLDPYSTAPGVVPPEIFYGRERERDLILEPNESCLIYGGRQLGKTALLRDVERTAHNPNQGLIARWIDLKTRGIGDYRNIDDIWILIADELKQWGVVPNNFRSNTNPDKLLECIKDWLDNPQRRILLLLDEADRFLEADGASSSSNGIRGEFIRVGRLKGLMDDTKRRFKVVFAGLHNVQRTARQPNHPLAHLGEALCIGPLLAEKEKWEARELIRRPLAAVGYEISDDLITRILSQTNYYPSLIQLYCKELLRHVSETRLERPRARYEITADQVDEAYRSKNLRREIRNRLEWTLQLDQRYEVIAYSIAYGTLIGKQRSSDGFAVSWVQEEVSYWWSKGFANNDEIKPLLEEMVGLGVLREVGDGRFTLRSPNLIRLMGTEEEIVEALLKDREPSPPYNPATFRPNFKLDSSCRSPLTAQQIAEFRSRKSGILVIFGCRASGIDELKEFFQFSFGDSCLRILEGVPILERFSERLDEELSFDKREQDGTTLILVESSCLWDKAWVDEALQQTSRKTSKRALVKVIFVADPRTAWNLWNQSDTVYPLPEAVTQIHLNLWHDSGVQQWLEDCSFTGLTQESRDKIRETTGNWHSLLQDFHNRSKNNPNRWEDALKEMETDFNNPKYLQKLSEKLGLKDCTLPYQQVLTTMAEYGENILEKDLLELLELDDSAHSDIVRRSLKWAQSLRLVEATGYECWRINPVVRRILSPL